MSDLISHYQSAFSLLLLVFCLACTSSQEVTESEQTITTEVSLTEGTNMASALSPDGTTLALDLQGTIWVMPAEGGKATSITDGLGDCHEPAWSPDGTQITFHSYKGGNYHIWAIDKDGSNLRQLTSGIYDDREPHWSPDGQSIVFSSDRNGNYDIWKVNLADGSLQALTDNPANDYHPAFAADGQIAYVSENKEAPGMYSMSSEGAGHQLRAASAYQLASPSWSPDQQHIVFTAYDGKNSQLIYHKLGSSEVGEVITTDEDIFPFRPVWLSAKEILYTADGSIKKRIIGQEGYTSIPFEATVTLTRSTYERKKYDFDNNSQQPALGIMGPVISPDGQSVAFTALGDVYHKRLNAEKSENITDDPFVDIDPTWSPDGKKLAFLSDRGGNMDLWIHELENGTFRRLVDLEDDLGFPAWSPDGKSIAFFARDSRNVWGNGELQIADVATGEINALEETYFVPSKPSWSPDSKTLAIMVLQPYSSRYREGVSQIMLIGTDGEVKDYISPEEGRTPAIRNVNGPVWSPDGISIAYVQDGTLWTLPVDAEGQPNGEPQQRTEELASAPSWTGDSQKILYLATDQLKLLDLASGQTTEIPLNLEWQRPINEGSYVVHAGRLFNGKDSTYQENVDIIVEGNRIKDIVPHQTGYDIPEIDASDKTIIPGLFEMHTHQHATAGEKLGRIWLAYGITNVREPGADPYDALERKEAWASGRRPGPREYFTGGLTDGSRVYYGLANSIIYSSHLQLEMDRAKRLGYDLIKTYVRMPDSLQKQITTAAHEIGIPVSSHEIYPAMGYNVDAVEHIRGTSRRGYSMKQSNLKKTYSDVVQLLAKSQMNITPTIGLQGGFYILADKNPNIYANRQLNVLYPESYLTTLRTSMQRIQRVFPSYLENFEEIQKGVSDIVQAGGRVTAGTDSPFIPYGTSLHVEMQLYVDGGLSPFQALQSATIRAAEAVGVANDLGTVEPGKLADFVMVEGDPLQNIEDAWNVVSTFKAGKRYDIEALLKAPAL